MCCLLCVVVCCLLLFCSLAVVVVVLFVGCCRCCLVCGAMFWSMAFHRKSKGAKAADFHESTKVEILWTAIPIVILIAMAVPATKTLIEMENNDNSDITIQVTGSQWKWHYKYFDQDIEFYSVLSTPREQYENQNGETAVKGDNYLLEVDKHLVIPVNKKVRFLITSDDVIHAWWVPAFAVKQDANPGFINEAWTKVDEPGIYRGQCAELCGKDHGFMPIVVEVLSEADYSAWLDEQNYTVFKISTVALISGSGVGPQTSGMQFWGYLDRYRSIWNNFPISNRPFLSSFSPDVHDNITSNPRWPHLFPRCP